MTRIFQGLQKFNYGSTVLDDLKEILKNKKKNLKIKNLMKKKNNFNQKIEKIEFKNIGFFYKTNNAALKNINITFKNNFFYGIEGETGSGKSTLVDLLSGLLKPSAGLFYINDNAYNHLGPTWFKKISYVTQNVSLVNDTLEKNIALGVDSAQIDYDKIKKIIKSAELSELSTEFLKNRNISVGERGIQISGGEKQRIGIARSLYFDRDIYIFDEATNALDFKTESIILKNLKNILKNKIVLIVSHKNNTFKFCDVVLKIKDKKLIELNNLPENDK